MQDLAMLVLSQNYSGGIRRQVNRRSVLAQILRKVKGEGKNVAWAAAFDGAHAESFAEGSDVTSFGSDKQAQALLSWGNYRATFSVSGLAMAAAATSRTPEGNLALWGRNMEDAATALASLINADIYAGNAANKIVGLDQAIGSIANTYAGIDRTNNDYAKWRPYLANAAGPAVALTMAQIRGDLAAIYKSSGSRPDVALCSPATLVAISSLFDPAREYTYTVMGADGPITLDGGVGTIRFDGCQFMEDKDVVDGKIYYLNSRAVEIEYLDMYAGKAMEIAATEDIDIVALTDGAEDMMLGALAEPLARTGDSDKAQLVIRLQVAVRQPNACGIRMNISIA
jgi:hypothetical protein